MAPAFVAPGTVVRAKWTIGPVVERGPVTTRYAATYRTGHPVLFDLLHESWSRDAELKASYLRASYLANRVDHPAVVRVLDDGTTEGGLTFVVTDRFEGETLGERARRLGGFIPRLDVYDIGDRLLDAVAAAHECGVVHGDLRPDRVILTRKGELRVTGFGSGRLLSMRFPSAETMRWSPPEAQVAGGVLDARSDVWAVAGCLYAAITGRFEPGAEGRVPPLHTYAPDAPVETAEAIDRALGRDRQHRWQTARQMQQSWRVAWAADGVPEQTVFETRKPSTDRPSAPAPGPVRRVTPAPMNAPLATPLPPYTQAQGFAHAQAQGQARMQATMAGGFAQAPMYIPTPGAFPAPATTASAQMAISYPPAPPPAPTPTPPPTQVTTVTIDDHGPESRTSISMAADSPAPALVPVVVGAAPSAAKSPSVTVEFPTSSGPGGPGAFAPPRPPEPQPSLEALGVVPSSRGRTLILVLVIVSFSLAMIAFVGRQIVVHLLARGVH
jgi:serine/threonine-protein kinase